MNDLDKINNVFESIKHIDENDNEFWYARELMKVLEYKRWDKFLNVIKSAVQSCINSNVYISYHFSQVGKMIPIAKNATRTIIDYKLSRYACYLVAQNADSRKEIVARAQTYFAVQTRRQELLEKEYENMSELERRIYQRNLTRKGNQALNETAKNAGVKNFGEFHNFGYRGLYNGETADDISKRKHLRYREDILDNMGSTELAANYFRITQTEDKLRKENIKGETNANLTHYDVGKKIRKAIADIGGTMPENLPTPNKSLKEIENKKSINSFHK